MAVPNGNQRMQGDNPQVRVVSILLICHPISTTAKVWVEKREMCLSLVSLLKVQSNPPSNGAQV